MAKKVIVTSAQHERKLKAKQEEQQRLHYKFTDHQRSVDNYTKRLCQQEGVPANEIEALREKICQSEAELAGVVSKKESLEKENSNIEASIVGLLSDHLKKVNGKAHTHVLSASEVIALAEEAELTLSQKGVTKKNRVGSELEYRPAGKEASATYARKAGPQITTFIRMLRVTDGWRLVEAHRDSAWCNQKERWQLKVSKAARDNIVNTAMTSISLHRDEAA